MKRKFFELAKKLSAKSNHPKHQLGCVIVDKNRIVSVGFNKIKTHTKSTHAFQMLHAELDAIIGVDKEELRGCTAYLYRNTKNGNLAISKPCLACEMALKEAGVKTVHYTVDGGYETLSLKE